MFKKFLSNDIVERMFWTFVQAFLAVFIVGLDQNFRVSSQLLMASATAGVAGVLSFLKNYVKDHNAQSSTE